MRTFWFFKNFRRLRSRPKPILTTNMLTWAPFPLATIFFLWFSNRQSISLITVTLYIINKKKKKSQYWWQKNARHVGWTHPAIVHHKIKVSIAIPQLIMQFLMLMWKDRMRLGNELCIFFQGRRFRTKRMEGGIRN